MRFIFGLITGIAIGAGAATAATSKSGLDIRGEFERIRADLEKRDFDAIGAHLEERFKELQHNLEERFDQEGKSAEDAAAGVAEDISEAFEESMEEPPKA